MEPKLLKLKNGQNIPADIFEVYMDIQKEGNYNMITEENQVMAILGIDTDTYSIIIKNYSELLELYNKE